VLTIFRYAMEPSPEGLKLSGPGEQVVLWREDGDVAMATPDAASFACIEALARGGTFDAAHAAALAQDPSFDLAACTANLIANGLVVTLTEIGSYADPHKETTP